MRRYHLITRPEEDALKLQEILQQKNKISLLNPLLKIKFLLKDLKGFFQNNHYSDICFIVTSVNSIRAIRAISPQYLQAITMIVSSTICFKEAQTLGIKSVSQCGICASDLEKFFQTNLDKNIKYIYICGADVTIDISHTLREQGLDCKKIVVYKAASAFLQKETVNFFQNSMISSVSIFSYRTALIFITEVIKNNLEDIISSVTVFTISKKIANLLNNRLVLNKIIVSEKYNNSAIANLIENEG